MGRNPVEDIYEETIFLESRCEEAEKKADAQASCMTENMQTQESYKAEKNKYFCFFRESCRDSGNFPFFARLG